ncbi:monosaccharide ABC transporter substrate-binding protein (CUT2 family) [Lentzea atacamensis]|uniref:Monosaccharide ABC transporter substrate-binding protein (CUT2 family) n=2 Tax=Lentzea TaxID=165301 RepID=A0A316ID93_9PSEU|nr:substrate-binding domain-containing protein [Lentzea atacamensis]PWK90660.1 monosaccharide ABC transporter substrate-binding protein (CUT2 family) [Lentzea atacamensis]RAS68117.1 monosaccharide ABC transporter substrate-binding protein (CUT2 family) [Lentzea atacamensis]
MKVTRRIALTLGAAALLATGCSGTGASGGSGITIGLAVSTLNNPFFVELQQGAQAMADQLGAKLTVMDAQNDATNQVNQVQTLVTQGVKAIILNPVDSKQSAPAAKAAEMANIPLISVDRSVEGKVAAEVASNNVSGGSLAAIELGRATSGEVAHLRGISGASASRDRGQGFEQGLNSGNIKVVATAVADFDRAKGLNETTNLLQGHPNIKGIFAENDEMALGAIKALGARAGKDVMVVGFDGTPDGLKAIQDGTLVATIAQQPKQLGSKAVEQAVKAAKGEPVQQVVDVEVKVITKQNVAEFIK